MNVVGYYVAVVGELFFAESTRTILHCDLPVEEFPHFAVRAEFPVSPGMMLIFDAPNAHLALASFSRDCLSAAAEERSVKRAQLIAAEPHGFLQIRIYWF
ncbi:MAG: hypothetical protein WCA21_08165 [Terracidiphilus sp.]